MAHLVIDPDHTVAAFHIRHFMVSDVHGQFNSLAGSVEFDPDNVPATSVEVEMDTESLWTGIAKRDAHLKSPDFFDVGKFPRILFKSTGVEVTASNRFLLTGDLTIRDVTMPVVFEAEFFGPAEYADETERTLTYGFRATATVDRETYGLRWNMPLSDGGFVVARYARLIINAEADRLI